MEEQKTRIEDLEAALKQERLCSRLCGAVLVCSPVSTDRSMLGMLEDGGQGQRRFLEPRTLCKP